MRNMKKWLGIITASVMCLAMGMTALAAPSPSTQGIVQEVESAKDSAGNTLEIVIEELPEESKEIAKQLESMDFVKEIVGADKFVEGMKVLDVQEAHVEGDPALVKWPATLTFKVPGVVATTKVAVLHYNKETGAWESVPCKAGNGTIEATFESLSPVAFVVDQNTMDNNATGSTTSPQTGERAVVMGFALIALLAAGGAFALNKKRA